MEVPVPNVAELHHHEAEGLPQSLNLPHHPGQGRAGHGDVLVHPLGTDAAQGGAHRPPGPPEGLGLRLARRADHLGPVTAGARLHQGKLLLHEVRLLPVRLHQEEGPAPGQAHPQVVLHGARAGRVHELHAGGHGPRGHRLGDRLGQGLHPGKVGQEGGPVPGQGKKAEPRPRHQAQGPLRADEEAREVVGGAPLALDPALVVHPLQLQNVVPGDPVLEAEGPPGVLRQVPPRVLVR